MSIFKISKKEMDKLTKAVMKDIGEEIRDNLQDEVIKLEGYYADNVAPSIVYDEAAHLVGSEHWGAAAIDDGTDWRWSSLPNFDRLTEWAIKYKSDGEFSSESASIPWKKQKNPRLKSYVLDIAKQIKEEGIQPTYYVKSVMGIFHRQVEMDY